MATLIGQALIRRGLKKNSIIHPCAAKHERRRTPNNCISGNEVKRGAVGEGGGRTTDRHTKTTFLPLFSPNLLVSQRWYGNSAIRRLVTFGILFCSSASNVCRHEYRKR
ncbi:hypothetical protein CEXT_560551 [Caerostris extrusa]|uniref:Uncharacterized protein n=1 Tax=Caerostris extrusa TaxID=172846 RepID=A0AAV4MCC7_CAEEX|nr:hypothetical protein CEXT_560551 [Caerostris extrusa]